MKQGGEWGSFWPYNYLPFAYNESAAAQYFPFTEEEARARGFQWRTVVEEAPDVKKVVSAADLPDSIREVTDEILQIAIRCAVSGKPFRIIKPELEFYRRMGLPLPRVHPEERHKRRMSLRNPYRLYPRTCAKCAKEMQTAYSPERQEKVYCEECYLHTVY